ncbi:D-alanyl-D-alanine carboxypeptidase family protein [Paenibacillus albicereus]|uniref:D-alanyl-D-alanine carboxypeptidase family protein n=1 Tax=Paenibacillus albicereus TaxID=2726185 RepID=UPI0038B2B4FE
MAIAGAWKRTAAAAAGLALLGASLLSAPAAKAADAADAPRPPATSAKAAALIDVESGRLLYSSESADEPMRIASLTKIMTAITAIEEGDLESMVTVGQRAVGKEGSSIYLKLGEKMKLKDMLYGLMLRSGNDAATAIAEHVGGSEEGFVKMMNDKAAWIGLERSTFMNPHGLDQEGHLSTANDLAKLTAYALKNPVFADIVGTKVHKAPNPFDSWDYSWANKNKMLALYEGADGVKTGYTKTALRCLVSSATRDGQQLAVVTLNDRDDWRDHASMLDWGFEHYRLKTLAAKGERLKGYPLASGRQLRYPLAEGEDAGLSNRLVLLSPEKDALAYSLGERGRLEWTLDGRPIGAVPIYEAGSSRIGQPDRATASFRPGGMFPSRPASLGAALSRSLKALFAAGGE